MENNQLKVFSVQFFKELGANVVESGDFIEVNSVPLKFQKFYGKNEPYKLVFDKSLANSTTELITSESYLLKMMRAYLDNVGDAALISLNYKLQVDSFVKGNLELKNCSIVKANANVSQNFLFKFTFQTTYRYLNEEERFVNDIYVDNGVVRNFDLSKFTTTNLNKKDFEMNKLRDYYTIAKEYVKESINKKTSIIAAELEESLTNEISRVNLYYEQQLKEINEHIAKINSSNSKSRYDPAELEKQKTQFLNEKDLFITNEQKKHALKLNTKLITTTVISYPVYSIEAFFKSGEVTRLAVIKFDPLNNITELPKCDLCKKNLSEIIICNGSHLVCTNCGSRCEDCNEISCDVCLKNVCAVTKRKTCKKCGRTCSRCRAFKNKRFMVADSSGRNFVCRDCN